MSPAASASRASCGRNGDERVTGLRQVGVLDAVDDEHPDVAGVDRAAQGDDLRRRVRAADGAGARDVDAEGGGERAGAELRQDERRAFLVGSPARQSVEHQG